MKNQFEWVPWFEELATKIRSEGKEYLIDCSRKVNWEKEEPKLLKFGDENIDPFSFYYFLASKIGMKKWEPLFESIHETFELSVNIPSIRENLILPIPPAVVLALFHDGKNFDPDLLWEIV